MKLLRWAAMGVFMALSVSANAGDDELVAEMKFWRSDVASSFETYWNPETEFGYAEFILVWNAYDGSHLSGYDVDQAKSVEVLSPKFPKQCQVTKIQGSLNYLDEGTSLIRVILKGAECGSWIDDLATKPLEARFQSVPRTIGTTVADSLLLKVLDTP